MDFSKVAAVTIAYESLQDLIHKRTGNPTANEEVPEMLRDAINFGAKVVLTDIYGQEALALKLDGEGRFVYEPVA